MLSMRRPALLLTEESEELVSFAVYVSPTTDATWTDVSKIVPSQTDVGITGTLGLLTPGAVHLTFPPHGGCCCRSGGGGGAARSWAPLCSPNTTLTTTHTCPDLCAITLFMIPVIYLLRGRVPQHWSHHLGI